MEVQVSGSNLKVRDTEVFLSVALKVGLVYRLRFEPATSQIRSIGAAHMQTCLHAQSKRTKMAADRNVVVGVAATADKRMELAREMLRTEISKTMK